MTSRLHEIVHFTQSMTFLFINHYVPRLLPYRAYNKMELTTTFTIVKLQNEIFSYQCVNDPLLYLLSLIVPDKWNSRSTNVPGYWPKWFILPKGHEGKAG